MPMNFNSDDVDSDYLRRFDGPRREEPGVCYGCGEDVPDGARDCGRPACRRRAVEPWLCERDER